jgi:hypothetical protein
MTVENSPNRRCANGDYEAARLTQLAFIAFLLDLSAFPRIALAQRSALLGLAVFYDCFSALTLPGRISPVRPDPL